MSRPVDVASQAPYTTKSICLSAVLAAVVFIMTFVPRIPIPLGYAHLGDAVIFLSFLYFNRREVVMPDIKGKENIEAYMKLVDMADKAGSSNTSWYSSYLLSAAGERRRARSIPSARSSLFSFPPCGWPSPIPWPVLCSLAAFRPVWLPCRDFSWKACSIPSLPWGPVFF